MIKCHRPNLKDCPYREENYNNVEDVITACHAQPCTFYFEQMLEQKLSQIPNMLEAVLQRVKNTTHGRGWPDCINVQVECPHKLESTNSADKIVYYCRSVPCKYQFEIIKNEKMSLSKF